MWFKCNNNDCYVTFPCSCAWAIRAALSEFEIWYKKNFSSGNDFPIATKMYAEVQCVEESDGIRVSFFPPVNTAGGNVSFMLNNEFIVINRAYGR